MNNTSLNAATIKHLENLKPYIHEAIQQGITDPKAAFEYAARRFAEFCIEMANGKTERAKAAIKLLGEKVYVHFNIIAVANRMPSR